MKKRIILWSTALMLAATGVHAQDDVKKVSKSDGFYMGVGAGVSYDVSMLSSGTYKESSSSGRYNVSSISDSNYGYLLYGGYQFNKIIAVEAAYTDFGTFKDVKTDSSGSTRELMSQPKSVSVYANAGYSFANGLRPFGQLGLGYMKRNLSDSLKNLNFNDSTMTLRFGLGLEYAPKALKGLGFRMAYIDEMAMDYNYEAADSDTDVSVSTTRMSFDSLIYVGAQYKF